MEEEVTMNQDHANNENKRRFSRIAFDAPVQIRQGTHHWISKVIDLSLKGVLIEQQNVTIVADERLTVRIDLSPDVVISAEAKWVHTERSCMGFSFKQIDLDSITHLKRLVELNIADSSLLERELSALG